jgi:membrane protease YdiL (CAAX protease family)
MSAGSVRPARAWTALVAGAIALGVDVLYVVILRSEGEGDLHRTRPQLIAASLAASAVVALGGWLVREPRLRLGLLTAASFTLLAWGFLAMFSIGLPVLVAGALLLATTDRAAEGVSTSEGFAITAATAVSALVLVALIVTTTS